MVYKELKQNENFNDTYSSWIIAYCLDTNSFFITNQRHFFGNMTQSFYEKEMLLIILETI